MVDGPAPSASLARADRPRAGAFAEFAARACVDAAAAEALTRAWASHGPLERRRLAEAVARDVAARGQDPGPLLRTWASLERDAGLKGQLEELARPRVAAHRREDAEGLKLWLVRRAGRVLEALCIEVEEGGRA
ncbi:MAG: hypothetical protein AAGH15_27375, partial [Myxococcota bacterium]